MGREIRLRARKSVLPLIIFVVGESGSPVVQFSLLMPRQLEKSERKRACESRYVALLGG